MEKLEDLATTAVDEANRARSQLDHMVGVGAGAGSGANGSGGGPVPAGAAAFAQRGRMRWPGM